MTTEKKFISEIYYPFYTKIDFNRNLYVQVIAYDRRDVVGKMPMMNDLCELLRYTSITVVCCNVRRDQSVVHTLAKMATCNQIFDFTALKGFMHFHRKNDLNTQNN